MDVKPYYIDNWLYDYFESLCEILFMKLAGDNNNKSQKCDMLIVGIKRIYSTHPTLFLPTIERCK
jgi:hypothetical protein